MFKIGDKITLKATPRNAKDLWGRTATVTEIKPSCEVHPKPRIVAEFDEPHRMNAVQFNASEAWKYIDGYDQDNPAPQSK